MNIKTDQQKIQTLIETVQTLTKDPLHQKALLKTATNYLDNMITVEMERSAMSGVLEQIGKIGT